MGITSLYLFYSQPIKGRRKGQGKGLKRSHRLAVDRMNCKQQRGHKTPQLRQKLGAESANNCGSSWLVAVETLCQVPEVEEDDGGVEEDVDEVVAPRVQLVDQVVDSEGEDGQRPIRLVTLLLKQIGQNVKNEKPIAGNKKVSFCKKGTREALALMYLSNLLKFLGDACLARMGVT